MLRLAWSSTVQELAEKLAAADPAIQSLDVSTVDGVRIAKGSQIGSLATKDVFVQYGPVRLLLQSPANSTEAVEVRLQVQETAVEHRTNA
jgi:hypothetical protein